MLRTHIYIFIFMFVLTIPITMMNSAWAAGDANGVAFSGDLRWNPDDGTIIADNGISVEYQGVKVTADKMQGSLKAKSIVFQGSVKLQSDDGVVFGKELTYDMASGDWSLDSGTSELLPKMVSSYVTSPMYISGNHIESVNGAIDVANGSFTTCDRQHPHYTFNVRQMTIYPNDRIVAQNVNMVMYGKQLFSVPRMVIPIKNMDIAMMPQAGSSSDEGYFLKLQYPYIATQTQTDILRLDLMSNKGVGLGVNHSYTMTSSNGVIDLYYLNDQSTGGANITGSLKHQQKIGSVDLGLISNYRQNNYLYYPQSKHYDAELSLDTNHAKSNTSLSLRRSVDRESTKSTDQSVSFRQMQTLSSSLNADFSVNMSSYDYTSMSGSDRELDTSIELIQQMKTYDLRLSMNKRVDLDGSHYTGDDQYSGLEKLPEISYETDSYRGNGLSLFGLPYRFMASAGYYNEMPADVSKGRLLLQLDTLDRAIDINNRNQLNLSGGYRQAIYDNNMAQYVTKFNALVTTRYSDYFKSRIGWNYQHSNGYSPFRFDYTSKYNYARAIFDYQQSNRLRFSLSSGYEFDNPEYPWQDVALRLTSYPSRRFSYSVSTGYDLNDGQWKTLINQFRLNIPKKISLELGTKYDLEKGSVDLMRGKIDLHIGQKWRLEGIAGWNGLTDDYEYKGVRITRDLHCMEAAITYVDETGFRDDNRISLELRIKAFPSPDRFGIGQYGQMVDTSMGEYYY